ncbi:tail fiber assembly protein [Escherichia coli]|uniref:tail fiber assembly protein n=1 Tax=Escherichia coli TaxID=562 RepID=UPI000DF94308|nr:tail fiber assembly protein [Escherichia coli]EFH3319824.1 hypothetical protein [Escherichia coli]EFL6466922.1 tail fiber assembly protein [Escherichia coli]EFM9092454.1 tail fiber assembly protein [Escherichia coli]EFN0679100.1 tail fiber assembly protein [Escherichia coli]EFQ3926660.1 tail fiber assembly protein [Escherichia coli]
MRAYFIPSVPTFIPESWKSDGTYTKENWPPDAVLLTEEETTAYWMIAPPEGKQLIAVDGKPAWVDIPPPTPEEQVAINERQRAKLRAIAGTEIAWRQDAVDAGIATDEETAALAGWKKYRVLLMRVNTANPVWPTPPGEQAS